MFRVTPGTLIMALFAVLLAALVALEVRRRMAPIVALTAAEKAEGMISVPIATRDLDTDRPLTDSDVGVAQFTPEQLRLRHPPEFYMRDVRQIIGRVLKNPLRKDGFFQAEDFYTDRMGKRLAERIEAGSRAVTIEVEDVGSLNGHIVPGAMVDVVFRSDKSGSGLPVGTMTLLSDVEILAVGDNTVIGAKSPPHAAAVKTLVTLEVPVDKANRLKIVEERGTLSLLMRGDNDRDVLVSSRPETLEGLMGIQPAKGPFISQMFHRGKASTLIFEDGRLIEHGMVSRPQSNSSQFGPASQGQPAPVAPPPAPGNQGAAAAADAEEEERTQDGG